MDSVQIVAILNITEDSFSDGGRYLSPEAALTHGRRLLENGADILEIGPASSHPDSESVSAADQIARLEPVLSGFPDLSSRISIDATHVEVLRFAIEAGVGMLNDVRGFGEQSLYPDLAACDARLVVMHSLLEGERADRRRASPTDVLDSIDAFFSERLNTLVRAGIAEDRLIVDPGMGFFLGSDPAASIAVLQRIPQLASRFGRPVFISVSRKSFLRAITDQTTEHAGAATLAAELYAIAHGAGFIRTHDPRALRDALEVQTALGRTSE